MPRVELVQASSEIPRTCAAAMRSCYSSWPAHSLFMDRTAFPDSEVSRMLRKAVELGHMDIFEHGFVTWIVEASPEEVLEALIEHRFLYVTRLGRDRWLITATLRSLLDTAGSNNAVLSELGRSLSRLAPWLSEQPPQQPIKQPPKEGYPEGPQVWLLSYTDFELLSDTVGSLPRERLLWHGGMTFSISGVSRSLTHQLVRHRLAAYSQQSQRHVAVARGRAWYGVPPGLPGDVAGEYAEFMDGVASLYAKLLGSGVRKEDARFVLPNATLTHITMSATAWEYRRMFSQRLDPAAQWEIRDVSWAMFSLAYIVAPSIAELEDPARSSSEVRGNLERLLPTLDRAREEFRRLPPGGVMEVAFPAGLLEHPVRAYAVRHAPSSV
ncbi:MAG: FAD-dependent thymidylate synthase [Conexivisphaera sp.]